MKTTLVEVFTHLMGKYLSVTKEMLMDGLSFTKATLFNIQFQNILTTLCIYLDKINKCRLDILCHYSTL